MIDSDVLGFESDMFGSSLGFLCSKLRCWVRVLEFVIESEILCSNVRFVGSSLRFCVRV